MWILREFEGFVLRVREVNGFEGLMDEWNSLLKRSLLGSSVFLTWEWLSTWWKHFGEGRKLLLLLVEDDDEVLAIAPLMLSRYKLPGFGAIKKVEFLSSRHSDYSNFVVLKREAECLRAMVDHLTGTVAGWDWIELKEIPETTENAGYLEQMFSDVPSNLKLNKRVCNVCPYISLPGSLDLLMERLSTRMRKNLNRCLRRIRGEHRVEFKRFDEAGFSVKEAMKTFLELHEKRWTSQGLPGSFRSKEAAFLDFHMDIAGRFADRGWLGLYFLMADDKPVATQYAFEFDWKMYDYLGGFDPQYSAYSVGNLFTMHLLEKCIQKGFTEYDMMRGDEAYKLAWNATCRNNLEVRLVRGGLHSRFFDWVTWNDAVSGLAEKLKLSLKRSHA